MALNEKQKIFCLEYLKDLNATQAAIRAGYAEGSARQQASHLLSNADIQEFISEQNASRINKSGVDASWLLTRLVDEAEADIADIYNEDGSLKPVHKWPKIWRTGLVAGIDTEELKMDGVAVGVIKKIKASDRVKRLEMIGKHISVGAFQENVKVSGLDGLADRLARAAARMKGENE